jgi:hypothetical protein
MHCTLPLSTIELVRLQHVPVGGDWRDLPFKNVYIAGARGKTKAKNSDPLLASSPAATDGSSVQLIQRWLVTSAKDNSEWKDCYGRLQWGGIYHTITTDPSPTAKMGRVLHPQQVAVVVAAVVAVGLPTSR